VAWPEEPTLEALLAAEADRLLRERSLGLKGLARAAVEQARPYLEVAHRVDWSAVPLVVGAEATGALRLGDDRSTRTIRFRADRVDLVGDGERLFTDYKTGAPPSGKRTRTALREWVAAGERLQAAAYVHGAGEGSLGRYLFLRPDLDDDSRTIIAPARDGQLRATFESTLRALLRAWDQGTFLPRLVEPDEDAEPPRCRSCRVAEACLRRDSGARARLRRWSEAIQADAAKKGLAESDGAFLGLWSLRRREPRE
jgi:hypothetical protein